MSNEQQNPTDRADDDRDPLGDGELIEEAEVRELRQGPPKGVLALALLLALTIGGGVLFGYRQVSALRASLTRIDQSLQQANQRQQRFEQALESTRTQFARQAEALEAQKRALAEQRQRLTEAREQLRKESEEMRQALSSVHQRIGRSNSDWIAAEAAYLLQVANVRLALEGDIDTAIAALRSADQRLRDTGDPSWIGVREIIAAEIARLKGVDAPDLPGLSARLSGLAGQLTELKLRGAEPQAAAAPPAAEPTAAESDRERSWKTLLRDGWEGFKSLMVVRYHGQPVKAMLPPEQQYFVYQNLRLQLEAARLALLSGRQALYDSSLQTAADWLNELFDTDQAATRAALDEIAALRQVRVRPPLPDISGSLQALRERLSQRVGGEAE